MGSDEKWGKLFPDDHPHPTIDETLEYLMDKLDWATEIRMGIDYNEEAEGGTHELLAILWGDSYYISCTIDRWNPALDLAELVRSIGEARDFYLAQISGETLNEGGDDYGAGI
jgi:hypothetical protein